MKHLTCLTLGTCLVLQAVPMNSRSGVAEAHIAFAQELKDVPLYMSTHIKELLGEQVTEQFETLTPASKKYAQFVHDHTRKMLPAKWRKDSDRVARALIESANRYQMDPAFLMAVIFQESSFNPDAMGAAGEVGLMQIKPSTARWMVLREGGSAPREAQIAEMLKDPAVNIRYGSAYLAHLREKFDRRQHHYISAYNMGPKNVMDRLKEGIEPRIYSDKVLSAYTTILGSLDTVDADALKRRVAAISGPTIGL